MSMKQVLDKVLGPADIVEEQKTEQKTAARLFAIIKKKRTGSYFLPA